IGELGGGKIELPGRDALLPVLADGEVRIGGKILHLVSRREFSSPDVAVPVVERREYRDGTELTSVEIVNRSLIVTVERQREALTRFDEDAGVVLVVILGERQGRSRRPFGRGPGECGRRSRRDPEEARHLH